jgi:hypothetical protein
MRRKAKDKHVTLEPKAIESTVHGPYRLPYGSLQGDNRKTPAHEAGVTNAGINATGSFDFAQDDELEAG